MSAQLLDGKLVSSALIEQVRQGIARAVGEGARQPCLAVVLVGDDPASAVYVKNKRLACERAGISAADYDLPAHTSEERLLALIDELNEDPAVDGILVQLPLPAHMDETAVINRVTREKDVDGFHAVNVGSLALRQPGLRPCTPRGVMVLLHHYGINSKGLHAVVVGASNIVGRPMSLELLLEGATVTTTHRFTRDLERHVRQAELLVVAVGKPGIVDAQWIPEGCIVVDIGINRDQNGQLCGDIEFEAAARRASWITPVPGGVGPMTVATLMLNTAEAAGIHIDDLPAGQGDPAPA